MNSSGLAYRKIDGIDIYFVGDIRKIQQHTVIKNYRCQYADAVDLQNALGRLATPGVGLVLADERTNTLIIRENPETLARIEDLLAALDKPTPQIYIQTAIVEISLTRENSTGFEWYWKNPKILSAGDRIATLFNLRQTTNQVGYYDNSGNTLGGGLPIGQGLGIGIVSKSFDAVLSALQTDKEVNILSRPYLITLDNKIASIEVGDQIPYKVLNQYGITSYEFKSATIKLLVKPHINNDQTITVDITPNADFQNGQTSDGTPIIARRTANTTIKIGNGETIVIGGLIRESNTKTISKVPLLGSIPLIGFLFRNKIDQKVKTELVVFINPTIVTDAVIDAQLQPEDQLSEKARQKLEQLENKTR
ncbi:MAG: secretin N-terminal domain-containing protein, partial [Candidatus Neomarinimicrobiota bacterium]